MRVKSGFGSDGVEVIIERCDDGGRRTAGRLYQASRSPRNRGRIRPLVGMPGSAPERVLLVTASAVSLPARINSTGDATGVNETCTRALSKSDR